MFDKNKTLLITSALPYANGSLHIGHMVEYVQTDIFVRFLRSKGIKVTYMCADDTHGTPIEIAAAKAGIKPEEIILKYHKEHQKDLADFLVKFDNYYTTHSDENKRYSDFFFNTLKEKGHIYQRSVEQTYCEKDGRYLPDRFVKGTCSKCKAEEQYGDQCEKCNSVYKPIDLIDPHCTVCGSTPVRKSSDHYFFKLSSFADRLKSWITDNNNLQPEIKNFALSWIKGGLEDWDITRDGPYFGFKIPGESDKYYYVWLDAPIGYVSASEKYAKDKLNQDASVYWKSVHAEIMHFIGKDIIYFHLLFWPAMLMGVGYNLPTDIVVHGHLTINSEKMSKSRGNFFTAREYLDKYDPELLRFYYASNLSKNVSDINLDFLDFYNRTNNELVSNISNFIYRTLNFINRNFDSKLGKISKKDAETVFELQSKFDKASRCYESLNIREAVKTILEISSAGNKLIQDNEPWKLIKTDKHRCHEILTLATNIVKNVSILLQPIMPAFSLKIQKQLNMPELTFSDLNFNTTEHSINLSRILLTNLERIPKIGTETFPANLKIAEINSVENHPEADKLYILQISIGTEKRQIVAGLREFYNPEELLKKKIVIVSNLKKARIRGKESQGMLLAAEDQGKAVLLQVPEAKSGENVKAGNLKSSDSEITIEQFYKLKLKVQSKRVLFGKKVLKTSNSDIIADASDGSKIK